MTANANNLGRFENAGFIAAVVGCCAAMALIGIIPRSERALFLKDDKLVPAKAFAAVVPPLDAAQSQVEQALLRSGDTRNATTRGARPTGNKAPQTTGSQLASTTPPLLPGTLPSLLSSGNAPGGPSPTDAGQPGGATPAPTGGGPSSTTPTPAGNSPSAPGLPTATAGAPAVAAVPEPATWMMMLLGFFAVGAAIRRRPTPTPVRVEPRA